MVLELGVNRLYQALNQLQPFRSSVKMTNPFEASRCLQQTMHVHALPLTDGKTLQSYQCRQGTVRTQLHSSPHMSKSSTAHSLHAQSPADSSPIALTLQGHNNSAADRPVDSRVVNIHSTPGSRDVQAGTNMTPSSKRKRSSKAQPLPPLQEAPGLPEKLGDQALRLVIVGHNPSDHAW